MVRVVYSDIHALGLNLDDCYLFLDTNIVSYFILCSHFECLWELRLLV